MTVTEAYASLQAKGAAAALVDVRTPEEFASGRATGAINIPLDELPQRAHEIDGYADVFMICRSGGRSAVATQLLGSLGFRGTVTNVEGGTMAWQYAGLPMER
ncbi:MAG TPA: rhodanese-like domain-containing protein [Candidatus Paceibacterota bacterium]